jgi:hypothetical protein
LKSTGESVTTLSATLAPPAPAYSPASGPCIILDADGTPLCRGRLEVRDGRMELRAVTPSGAIASAFFGRGRRRFLLAGATAETTPIIMRRCWWQDGERACEIELLLQSIAA